MAKIYSNENFYYAVVEHLQSFGHDVLTSKAAGNANKRIPDEDVLAFAIANKRVVLTFNYRHLIRLHRFFPEHFGIIVCSEDKNYLALAQRIHAAI
jgi:predicted nuclease of predicted toxin-antitoxin system